ncbi:MAG: TIGR00725 family protein [Dehalococcoidaceae bacterium]|nr:TIGR00725 family protein [Dehalococcoidaceae bacterium]
MNAKRTIAVIGGSRATDRELKLAEETGREIARSGAVLVCGGLGGVMEAACRGAVSAGGTTVGILPGDHRSSANSCVTIPVVTGMGYARNAVVAKSAQVVIAIGGSYGTLSEISYALQSGIPVIGIDTWQISRKEKEDNSIVRMDSPREAVNLAIEMINDRLEGD